MTHTEAADLVLSAAQKVPLSWYKSQERAAILAAVATVMDAARADALEESAKYAAHLFSVIENAADIFDNGDGGTPRLRNALDQALATTGTMEKL